VASALTKAFTVIRLLRRTNGTLGLTDIARSLKIAPSSAHSTLSELINEGAVIQDSDRRYRLGPATFYFGAGYARTVPIYRTVWSQLVEAARELSLTAVVAIPWEDHHLMLNVHQSGGPGVDVAFGGRVPIDAGSFGKAYFAWSGAKVPEQVVKYTANSITEHKQLAAEVARDRERGYATDNEEFTIGVGAVGSGVTSERGFEGIASLIGPIAQVSDLGFERVGRRLAAIAALASLTLGDPGRVKVVGDA
jgi:DNA-binding IclR family transcriptional regulator